MKASEIYLIQVSKQEFLEMFRFGILNGKDKRDKCWSICSKQKGKRKKRYVSEYEYNKYLKVKTKAEVGS